MKIIARICVLVVVLLVSLSACNITTDNNSNSNSSNALGDDYLDEVRKQAFRYNSARDVVDQTIRATDSATTLHQGIDAARRGVSDLEGAIRQMNEAYRALGNIRGVPIKYHEHQQSTLSAWRAGIEATTTVRLYLDKFPSIDQKDDALILAANRLFGEEDRHQLVARRALEAVR